MSRVYEDPCLDVFEASPPSPDQVPPLLHTGARHAGTLDSVHNNKYSVHCTYVHCTNHSRLYTVKAKVQCYLYLCQYCEHSTNHSKVYTVQVIVQGYQYICQYCVHSSNHSEVYTVQNIVVYTVHNIVMYTLYITMFSVQHRQNVYCTTYVHLSTL